MKQRSKGGMWWPMTRLAFHSILANKLRAFLTLLGIIIGVASVVLVGAGIEGGEQYLVDTVSAALGSDSFLISKYPRFGHISREEFRRAARRNAELQISDIDFLKENCPDCGEIAGQLATTRPIYRASHEIYGTRIWGVTANFVFLSNLELTEGRFFTESEVLRSQYVCVIGEDLREALFKGLDPVGKTIKFSNRPLRVIGILEKQGSAFGQSLDNVVYMPLSSFQKMYGSRTTIDIRGQSASSERFEAALDQVRVAMRIRHQLKPNQEDDFGLTSTEEINESVGQFAAAVQMVVIPITAIALLVGGIVVMNIMLVTVTERTSEIGLRKSLGARRSDILYQFLVEACLLAVMGGLTGLLLAAGLSWLVEQTTPIPMNITLGYMLASVGVSGGIGILFGIFPAYRASRLDPIIALAAER